MGPISGLIDFGGNILAAGLNHKWQKQQLSQNEQWAREDATTAYNRQIEQWNRENAYNTPKAQMQRALEAGLNPNLYLAQQGLGNGSFGAPVVPQASSASGNAYAVPTGLTSFVDAEYKKALISRLHNQNENDDKRTEQDVKESMSRINVNGQRVQELISNVRLLDANTDYTIIRSMRESEDRRRVALDNTFTLATMRNAIDKFSAETHIAVENSRNIAEMLSAEILGLKARTRLDLANERESNAMVSQIQAVADLYREELGIKNLETLMSTGVNVKDGSVVSNQRFNDALKSYSSQWSILDSQNKILRKSADLAQKYGDANMIVSLINLGCSSVKSLSDAVSNFVPKRSLKRNDVFYHDE